MNTSISKRHSLVYQGKNGAIELRGDARQETIWATQLQIAEIFAINRTVVTKHIARILKQREIDEKSNVQKVHIASSDKPVAFYSLDMVLAVGYRTNSAKAIQFRKWASGILKRYVASGYVLNPKTVKRNYAAFQQALQDIKGLLPAGSAVDRASVLELVSAFADTWLSLDAYDKDALVATGATKKAVALTVEQVGSALADFKAALIKKGEATELFGLERGVGSLAGIIGNVMQSFGGKDVYPSVEEKAAHLLYFMVKNHPFADGNKRNGAYAFIWFLQRNKALDRSQITPAALTALTLFIAESDPKEKDRMVRLVLQLLKK